MKTLASCLVAASFLSATAIAAPVTYDGITFPDGDVSFADAVVSYTNGNPGLGYASATSSNYTDPAAAVGPPDYVNPDGSVSLGRGGTLILRFTDNSLTGSGDAAADLHVFEIGPDVEDTFVAISQNGIDFLEVGKVFGSTSSIDIDPFLLAEGLDPFTRFTFVRLIDDPNEGQSAGSTVGADIDAVGAISSAAPVPLPAASLLFVAGLGGLGALRRKKTVG